MNDDASALLDLHEWIFVRLESQLLWPKEERGKHERRVGQAKEFVLRIVAEMGVRGFLFDDRTVKQNLSRLVADVGQRQRDGKLRGPLYPYFRAVCRQYVERNADRMNERAKSGGYHISSFLPNANEPLPLPMLSAMQMRARLDARALVSAVKRRRKANEDNQSTFDLAASPFVSRSPHTIGNSTRSEI